MTALYIALAQLFGSLVVNKIASDRTAAADKVKLMQTVDELWEKANAAHIQVQTGEKSDESKS